MSSVAIRGRRLRAVYRRSADAVIIRSNSLRREGAPFDLATFNVASYDSANQPEKTCRNRALTAP